ncbi:MAG: 5-oxoprolinase subunit PxpB [Betaproteobacteria bacterium]
MARAPKLLGVWPLGDLAAYAEFSPTLDFEVNAFVQRLALAVYARQEPELRDVVPALGGLALHFHPHFTGDLVQFTLSVVQRALEDGLPPAAQVGREVDVPVCYEAEFAPDLAEVARRLRLEPEEVVRRHAAAEYRVLMIGFAPGHAYMGGLDPSLALSRRSAPRPEVPAGSVAIANEQTVVYPYAISGGWNVIGRTPLVAFDATREPPSLFAAGDRVRFRSIPRFEFEKLIP